MKKLAGVVILYNPPEEVYDNIMTYYPYLDWLFVLDNSEKINEDLVCKIKQLSNVKYICHGENKGIAYSLNEALKLCNDKFEWLLTMDQDSSFKDGMLDGYIRCLDNLDINVYGIASARREAESSRGKLVLINHCITSGNIIRVKIAIAVGGFDENLFIDEVDNEFCYRCNAHGYLLLKYQRKIMNHALGTPTTFTMFGGGITKHFSMHNHIRYYYFIRNRLYVMSHYPEIRWHYLYVIIKDIIKIFFCNEDRMKKFKYSFKGYKDFKHNRMGKLIDKE